MYTHAHKQPDWQTNSQAGRPTDRLFSIIYTIEQYSVKHNFTVCRYPVRPVHKVLSRSALQVLWMWLQ